MRLLPAATLAVTALALNACGPAPSRPYVGAGFTPTVVTPAAVSVERRWASECRTNRFHDRQDCDLSLRISSDRPIVAGSLASDDGGRTWSIAASPYPVTFRIRVDQNPVIEGICRGPAFSCDVSAAPGGRNLTDQLANGRQLAVQVTTVRGQLDRDYQIAGFQEALAEVRAKLPPQPASPARARRATTSR